MGSSGNLVGDYLIVKTESFVLREGKYLRRKALVYDDQEVGVGVP